MSVLSENDINVTIGDLLTKLFNTIIHAQIQNEAISDILKILDIKLPDFEIDKSFASTITDLINSSSKKYYVRTIKHKLNYSRDGLFTVNIICSIGDRTEPFFDSNIYIYLYIPSENVDILMKYLNT